MSHEIPFHATRMGQRYYERTLPELAEQIRRLAEALERLREQTQDEKRCYGAPE